ncbi:hypothetical protein E4N66_06480 [Treponema sp. OMZ 857]|nr:hypothetical protein E4N66_06480 [Treponema sp. OMZ 857]
MLAGSLQSDCFSRSYYPCNISRGVDVKEWQNCPLDKSYPILFLDALRVNCRQDGRTVNKAL